MARGESVTLEIEGQQVPLSNPAKLFFPDAGVTKLDRHLGGSVGMDIVDDPLPAGALLLIQGVSEVLKSIYAAVNNAWPPALVSPPPDGVLGTPGAGI